MSEKDGMCDACGLGVVDALPVGKRCEDCGDALRVCAREWGRGGSSRCSVWRGGPGVEMARPRV